ncbi:hypothetical protein FB451DRAFT_1375763 [Mycena latifolia]|nr:hypothetical protein FB451DRAFT_1375763 [Mycena latifolia]
MSAVRTVMVEAGDTSWDVAAFVEGETSVVERPPKDDRPKAQKTILARLLQQQDNMLNIVEELRALVDEERTTSTETLKALLTLQKQAVDKKEVEIAEADTNEQHEAYDRCIRELGFNDIIFDITRPKINGAVVLTKKEKDTLKSNQLGYITHLFDPSIKRKGKGPLPSDAKSARQRALSILSKEQRGLCKALITQFDAGRDVRNEKQHPTPDLATALERTRDTAGQYVQTLECFLATNPKKMKGARDTEETDLDLFAAKGTYTAISRLKKDLENMKAEKQTTEMRLEQRLAKK